MDMPSFETMSIHAPSTLEALGSLDFPPNFRPPRKVLANLSPPNVYLDLNALNMTAIEELDIYSYPGLEFASHT